MVTISDFIYYFLASLLATTFIVAASAKIYNLSSFNSALLEFGISEKISKYLVYSIPLWELTISVLILLPTGFLWGGISALITLTLFTFFLSYHLFQRKKIVCNCFGSFSSKPTTWIAVLRNLALICVCILFLVLPLPPITANFYIQIAIFTTSVALVEGYLLWRLYNNSAIALPEEKKSIRIKAPSFNISTIDGNTVTLESLTIPGKNILLVFIDPICGPCEKLLPYLSIWQKQLKTELTVLLISSRSIEENRQKIQQYDINNVAIQKDFEVAKAFNIKVTPSAIIIEADGFIVSTAIGLEEIVKQVLSRNLSSTAQNVGLLSENAHEKEKLSSLDVGTLLPKIWLSDKEGYSIPVLDSTKRPTFLLFWEPDCKDCNNFLEVIESEIAKLEVRPKTILLTAKYPTNLPECFENIAVDPYLKSIKALKIEILPAAILIDYKGKIKLPLASGNKDILNMIYMIQHMSQQQIVSHSLKN